LSFHKLKKTKTFVTFVVLMQIQKNCFPFQPYDKIMHLYKVILSLKKK